MTDKQDDFPLNKVPVYQTGYRNVLKVDIVEIPLQKVTEAIVKAVPEIMELKFGCKIRHKQISWNYVSHWDREDNGVYSKTMNLYSEEEHRTGGAYTAHVNDDDVDNYKVLGRPITLFDCAQVVKDKHRLIDMWQKGSLEDQSTELIEWVDSQL